MQREQGIVTPIIDAFIKIRIALTRQKIAAAIFVGAAILGAGKLAVVLGSLDEGGTTQPCTQDHYPKCGPNAYQVASDIQAADAPVLGVSTGGPCILKYNR